MFNFLKNKRIFQLEKQYFPIFNFIVLAVFLFMFFALTWQVLQVEFWRHDAWGYSISEVNEFKSSARWGAPIAHQLLGWMPHKVAWILSILMLWVYFFIFLKRFFGDDEKYNKIIFLMPFFVIFQPGLIGQLFWPTHSLSAIIPLFIASFFARKNNNYAASFIAAILSFSILQTYAFLAIFIAIPNIDSVIRKRFFDLFKTLSSVWVLWVVSIISAALIAKSMQFFAFGEIPELESWRNPNPVRSVSDLLNNLSVNYETFVSHFSIAFNKILVLAASLVYLLFLMFNLSKKEFNTASLSVWLGITGLAVASSIYVAAIPDGVMVSTRTTFLFGGGAILFFLGLAILLFTAKEKYLIPESIITIFIFAAIITPYTVSYANAKWYSTFTRDVVSSISEIEESNPRYISHVIIDMEEIREGRNIWPLDYSDILPVDKKFIEGLDSKERIAKAFHEKGYNSVIWCTQENSHDKCLKTREATAVRCSFTNPSVCSYGIDNSVWYIKF